MFRMSVTMTMKNTTAAALLVLGLAAPAMAQTSPGLRPGDDDGTRPYSRWHLGVLSGTQTVDDTGATFGAELGIRMKKGFHFLLEAGRMSDVTTADRRAELAGYAEFVQGAYNVPVTSSMTGPTIFGMVGLQLIPDGKPREQSSGVRPYLLATVGIARVEYKPGFVVEGASVSGAGIVNYGVELGRDLLGTTNRFAYSGGGGLILGDTWYLDLGVRITRIHTTDHPTTVKRVAIGLGRRF